MFHSNLSSVSHRTTLSLHIRNSDRQRDPEMSKPAKTPFEIEIVFKEILGYVGTDHSSLLACRLVSHYWNKFALEVAAELGTRLLVAPCEDCSISLERSGNVKVPWWFPMFDLTNPNLKGMLCLCLNHKEAGSVGRLASAISFLELGVKTSAIQTVGDPFYKAIADGNNNLLITSITYEAGFGNCSDDEVANLHRLLCACAPNLKELKYIEHGHGRYEDFDPNCSSNCIEFPSLTSAYFTSMSSTIGNQYINPLWVHVVNLSPKLATLEFGFSYREGTFPHPHAQLGGVHVRQPPLVQLLSPETRERIQELRIPFAPDLIFGRSKGFEFPNLKRLVLHLSTHSLVMDRDILFNVLEQEAESLESLELVWLKNPKADASIWEPPPADGWLERFPELPNLKHFGITTMDYDMETLSLIQQILRRVAKQCADTHFNYCLN